MPRMIHYMIYNFNDSLNENVVYGAERNLMCIGVIPNLVPMHGRFCAAVCLSEIAQLITGFTDSTTCDSLTSLINSNGCCLNNVVIIARSGITGSFTTRIRLGIPN